MRAKLEAELTKVAPMPALDPIALLMAETGLSRSELLEMPVTTLNDYRVLKRAQAQAMQEN
jgi:hypothetical protein